MNRMTKSCLCLFATAVALSVVSGCGTSPRPRFYLVEPHGLWRDTGVRDAAQSQFLVRVLPVRLSPYLDRPQIVTRIDQSEIKVDQFNRWGMPLDRLVRETVAAGIVKDLPGSYVDLALSRAVGDFDYLVSLELLRLDGVLGNGVDLIAQIAVIRGSEVKAKPVSRLVVSHTVATADKSYDAYVAAINEALASLASDVAAAIATDRTVSAEANAK